jgi:hypothetical protein
MQQGFVLSGEEIGFVVLFYVGLYAVHLFCQVLIFDFDIFSSDQFFDHLIFIEARQLLPSSNAVDFGVYKFAL